MILRLCMGLLTIVLASACRGPEPPRPTEDLRPSVVGVIASEDVAEPFLLEGGASFDPPDGAAVRPLQNWPGSSVLEPDEFVKGLLLLGGQGEDGGWWYEIAGVGGANEDGCWPIYGGAFDEGDSVHFTSGLRVPKLPTFVIRTNGPDDDRGFPAHQDDSVCLDARGNAVYLDLFVYL